MRYHPIRVYQGLLDFKKERAYYRNMGIEHFGAVGFM